MYYFRRGGGRGTTVARGGRGEGGRCDQRVDVEMEMKKSEQEGKKTWQN